MEWAGIRPERNLPWYFLVFVNGLTHGIGVETGPSAMCFWRVDEEGVSLFLDLRNGTEAVLSGDRVIEAAVLRVRNGREGESPFQAHRTFCQTLCPDPVMPNHPVYGGNNWYYTYGLTSSREEILRDSAVISDLCDTDNRPYMVIDNGWQSCSYYGDYNGGPWDRGNFFFPDMSSLAGKMAAEGVRPEYGFVLCRLLKSIPFPGGGSMNPRADTNWIPACPKYWTLLPMIPVVCAETGDFR